MNEHGAFLREQADDAASDGLPTTAEHFTAAADEIKRLDAENKRLQSDIDNAVKQSKEAAEQAAAAAAHHAMTGD